MRPETKIEDERFSNCQQGGLGWNREAGQSSSNVECAEVGLGGAGKGKEFRASTSKERMQR